MEGFTDTGVCNPSLVSIDFQLFRRRKLETTASQLCLTLALCDLWMSCVSAPSVDDNIYPTETACQDTHARSSTDVAVSLQDSGCSLISLGFSTRSVKEPDLFFFKQCPGYWALTQLTSCNIRLFFFNKF